MNPRRLSILQLIGLAAFALLALQLVRVQLFETARFRQITSEQRLRILPVESPRGLIVDRDGVIVAGNSPAFSVVVVPADLPTAPAERRAALLDAEAATGIPFSRIEQRVLTGLASVDPLARVELRSGLTIDEAIATRALLAGTPGFQVVAKAIRTYNGADLLAHILGYVGPITPDEVEAYLDAGYEFDARVGRTGVEQTYEDVLRGTNGQRLVLADPAGREIEEIGEVEPVAGADLILTIDLDLQAAVRDALAAGIRRGALAAVAERGRPEQPELAVGAAVLMDVHTGELLAFVSLPSFDADIFSGAPDQDLVSAVLANPARPLISRTYMEVMAPGSIFKPIIGAAALEEGVATPSTLITSRGFISVQDEFNPDVRYIFRDWAAHGTLDFYGGIARSSDVYYYYLSGGYRENGKELFEGLGILRLADYVRAFGLGAPTGIDLPGEAGGLVPDPDWKEEAIGEPWVLGDTYTMGIGQGFLTVTPLQMAVAGAAIANGGQILEPRVVHALRRGERIEPLPTRVASTVPVGPEHLETVRVAMRLAADAGGTARGGEPAGMTIGGKTGTAEFGIPAADGSFDTHAWYLGFAPYDEPEVVVVVYLEFGVGSTHAAPVAKSILEAYFAGGAADSAQVATAEQGEPP